MEFSEIASVSGKGGLFKIISPTKSGVILEALDETKKKMVVGMQNKVSVLSDISIYTTDEEGAKPLAEVMRKVHKEFKGEIGLNSSSDPDELKAFLKFILPEYDENRVYVSDIKKLVSWYHQLAKLDPEIFNEKKEDKDDKKEKKETGDVKKAPTPKTSAMKAPQAPKASTKPAKATPKSTQRKSG